jgi:Lrp/AsnC family leucine-responsive transcriptional regulator
MAVDATRKTAAGPRATSETAEFETVIDRLKAESGVRELHSRLLLHEVALGPDRTLAT